MDHYRMTKVEIDARVIARLEALQDQIQPLLDRGPLSTTNLVSLLLDHWQAGSPPAREWVKNQSGLYPANTGRRLDGRSKRSRG